MSDKQYDTLVVTGMGDAVPRSVQHGDRILEVTAWSSGHELNKATKLEEFVFDLSMGVIPEDEIEARAAALIDEVRKP